MKKIICSWIISMLMCFTLAGCNISDSGPAAESMEQSNIEIIEQNINETETTQTEAQEKPEEEIEKEKQTEGELKVTMLDVGQGLSVLFETNGHYMLYDGGNRKHSSYVVAYLKQHEVTNIDYLIASHYDEDHIAGLIGALKTVTVDTAIIPNYKADTDIYSSFMNAVNNANTVEYAEKGNSYNFGNATIDVLYGCDGTENSANDMSTVVKVSEGNFSCVLTGDAEYDTENTLLNNESNLNCTLYVVGHHGSSSSSSINFIKAMSPELAFISVGEDNKYGHPTDKTLDVLQNNGAAVYRTDKQGVITLTFENGQYTISTEKENVTEVINSAEDATEDATEDVTYVLNTKSMKFHCCNCSAVDKIADHNKEYSSKTREELIEEGYDPCGMCKP